MAVAAKKKNLRKDKVNEIIRAEDNWEPVGHTPMPELPDLRNWDMRLLKTYKPFYAPMCDLCCFCTYGKCDLTGDKRGACGIDISTQQARVVLLACCMGMSAHGGHARHVLHYLIEKHGKDYKINLGDQILVEAPHIRTVMGLKPETLGDLEKVMDYVESQLIHAVSALHTGQEGSALDYESKALHISMLDHVAMEVGDIAEIVGFGYPTSVADTPLVGLGWGAVDRTKPVILLIGHNPVTAIPIVDYINANGLQDKVEVAGICCTALEVTRYSDKAKVVGPLSRQLFFIRTGIADVIVTDEQCIRTDVPIEAAKVGSAVIATSDKVCYGLDNDTKKEADEIVRDMVNQGKQTLILDPDKAAEVAVKVAMELAPKRNKVLVKPEEVPDLAKDHKLCNMCSQVCPNLLPVGDAIEAAKNGNLQPLTDVFNKCIGCGKCDQECPRHVPIIKMMQAAASWESWNVRSGRGPIMDVEIRKVGAPIVLGTIPGIIAIVGCSNFPEEITEIADIAEEFAKRKYIVVLSGCSAMAAGMKKDKDGKTIYEKYPPNFDAGGVLNVGSCVANSHITGAAMKVANIFATLPLRGNYEVIADYILNRVGACGLAWGAYSQKAASIATGCNRLGIPVVLGPHSAKYRRLYMSRKEEDDWTVMDGREKKLVNTEEPSPEHLITVVESKERAMITMAKLCIRKNDTAQGRQLKLTHYIALHKQYMGTLPDDLHLFVRKATDIPIFFKKEVMAYLEKVGWKEKPVLTLPTLIGTYPSEVPLDAVVH
ncbi:MAG: CO dehydrogenase/acetyl-CoA synthase complex subunit epsilon [Chloroflexi bacterium RBG_13_50_10]|nr:MAG: CO dehydrogenase/acetyl-CoA synthase complex subunit epsilon [Chloroflexi bacterium RBG_13_50_10]